MIKDSMKETVLISVNSLDLMKNLNKTIQMTIQIIHILNEIVVFAKKMMSLDKGVKWRVAIKIDNKKLEISN